MYVDELSYSNIIVGLLKNNYGNYVIQRVLRYSTGNSKLSLINLIIKNMEKLGDRRLILKWKGIIDGIISNNQNQSLNQNEIFYHKDIVCSPIISHCNKTSFHSYKSLYNPKFKHLVGNNSKNSQDDYSPKKDF